MKRTNYPAGSGAAVKHEASELSKRLSKLGDESDDARKVADNEYLERIHLGMRDAYHHAAALARQSAPTAGDPLLVARIKRYAKVFGCSIKDAKTACDSDRDLNGDKTAFIEPPTAPFGYIVRQPDGHETYFKKDPSVFRANGWPELRVTVHTLFEGGCGASISGDSLEETIEAWNRRVSAVPETLTPAMIDAVYPKWTFSPNAMWQDLRNAIINHKE